MDIVFMQPALSDSTLLKKKLQKHKGKAHLYKRFWKL